VDDEDSGLVDALGRAREGSQRRIRELLQSSPRRAHALLRASIRRGLIAEDDTVEEHELILSMMMSRNSIRSALQMLGNEGLIRRRQRIGTTMVGQIWEMPLLSLLPTQGWNLGVDTDEHPAGIRLESRSIESGEVIAHEHIRRRLNLDGARIFMAEELVHIDEMPVGIIVGYYPLASSTSGDRRDDLNAYLNTLRTRPSMQVEATVEAVNADERTARLLGLREGAAILTRETLLRDGDGTPRMLAYGHYRGDRVALWAEDHDVAAMRPVAGESRA
jgi:GntR family transcriptional regulator